MDIYLTEISSGQRLRIPLLPDRLSIKTGALSVAVNVIKTGEVKIPRGTALMGYSWNGVFPSAAMENASYVFDWQEPERIIAQIRDWEEKNSILRLMITELSISADVFIESFTGDFYGTGSFAYTINLTTHKELTITTIAPEDAPLEEPGSAADTGKRGTVKTSGGRLNIRKKPSTESSVIGKYENGTKVEILGKTGNWYIVPHSEGTNSKGYVYASYIKLEGSSESSGSSKSSKSGDSSKSSKSSSGASTSGTSSGYTVKKGESLFSIAKAKLGDVKRIEELYELNKEAIDAANQGTTNSKYTLPENIKLKLPANAQVKPSSSSSSVFTKTVTKAKEIITVATQKLVTNKPTKNITDTLKTASQKDIKTKK